MVNLGCGTRIHPEWINIDLHPLAPGVRRANFIDGIPLPDASAACVYHSHLLEHLPPGKARAFLVECRRVLAPGGVLRIVVPDFEASARDYIEAIDRRRRGEALSAEHRWFLIEMIDQIARSRPGGEMVKMIEEDHSHDDFIAKRLGSFGAGLIHSIRAQSGTPPARRKIDRLTGFASKVLPKSWARAFGEVLFRQLGEVHYWMYDELSLGDLLRELGFANPVRRTHLTSSVADWARYGLDAEPDGSPYKGTSLYLEASRPS